MPNFTHVILVFVSLINVNKNYMYLYEMISNLYYIHTGIVYECIFFSVVSLK